MRTPGLILLLSILSAPALAENFSGKWAFEFQDRGRTLQSTLILNHAGTDVTGVLLSQPRSSEPFPGDAEVQEGKAEGKEISFYVWTGRDQPVKAIYRGTLSGEEIRFDVTGGPPGAGIGGRPRTDSDDPQRVMARRTR